MPHFLRCCKGSSQIGMPGSQLWLTSFCPKFPQLNLTTSRTQYAKSSMSVLQIKQICKLKLETRPGPKRPVAEGVIFVLTTKVLALLKLVDRRRGRIRLRWTMNLWVEHVWFLDLHVDETRSRVKNLFVPTYPISLCIGENEILRPGSGINCFIYSMHSMQSWHRYGSCWQGRSL